MSRRAAALLGDRRGGAPAVRPAALRARQGARGARPRRARRRARAAGARRRTRSREMGRDLEPALTELAALGHGAGSLTARLACAGLRRDARARPVSARPAVRSCADARRPPPPTTSRRSARSATSASSGFWFTDILGQLKSFSIDNDELDDAFEGGMGFDGSSITGFNAIEESDMIAMPDPTTFAVLPWRPEEQGVGAHVLRRPDARAHALRGRPAPRAAPRARARRGDGLRPLQRRPGARVLPTSRTRTAPRCSTRAATSTSRRSTPAPTCAARPSSRSSSSASTSSTATTRSARASTRSTCATPTR